MKKTTRADGLIDFAARHLHDAGSFSKQRRTLTSLTHAGDVLRLVRNSKLEYLRISVNLKHISRSDFVEELNNLQICVEQFALVRPDAERYSPIGDRQTSLVHWLMSNAFLRWKSQVLFCEYVKSVTSLPSFEGIKGVSFTHADLPSDSALLDRFVHAGFVEDLRISVEAFTEIRASANLDFFSRMISAFIKGLPIRYMELVWHFVDQLSRIRLDINQILGEAGFELAGTANFQLTDSRKQRVVVSRRQSDVRPVTVLASHVFCRNDHLGVRLRFFSSELMIDEQGNLSISDEQRQAALTFL